MYKKRNHDHSEFQIYKLYHYSRFQVWNTLQNQKKFHLEYILTLSLMFISLSFISQKFLELPISNVLSHPTQKYTLSDLIF